MIQGTEQWHDERGVRLTASRFGDVLAGPETKRRAEYMQEIVWNLRGVPDFARDDDKPWHRNGKQWEDHARGLYEFQTGQDVVQTAFLQHPTIEYVGASPDGLVTTQGGIEIKCRSSVRAHLASKAKGIPSEHIPQVQGNLWVSGRDWWDFVSYYRSADGKRSDLHIHRVLPDPAVFKKLEAACAAFWDEVQSRIKQAA